MNITWSIIVCSHNRAADLRANLPRLKLLDYPKDGYEIIVIDNASTDATADVAASEGLTCIREERLGLSHARNRGIESARGRFVAFIDDDAWPDPGWLNELEHAFAQSGAGCVGGKVIPEWQGTRNDWPDWVHPILQAQYSVTRYGDAPHTTKYPNIPAGTNIAFRSSLLAEIGGFRPDLGRRGSCLISGEEGELCLRVEKAGHGVYYQPTAVVHHQIPETRLSEQWLLDRCHWQGITSAIVERVSMPNRRNLYRVLRCAALILAAQIIAPAARLLNDKKVSFLCRCQTALWRSYIDEKIRRRVSVNESP
jgi:Predicted glycosyltransferases